MSKPEDVPQRVWDEASEWSFTDTGDFEFDLTVTIARAILAAEQRERMNCVSVALSFIEYGGDTHHGITINPMADAQKIATAIRNRSGE